MFAHRPLPCLYKGRADKDLRLAIWLPARGISPQWEMMAQALPPHQWFQLFVVDEVELSDEVIEMLVACVDVGLGTHLADAVEVVDVDVDEDTE